METIFFETVEGYFLGELIEDYGDSFLVRVLIANGTEVKQTTYSLVKRIGA